MDEKAIEVQALTKTFGQGGVVVHAVRNIDLTVGRGEVVLIMGPSGSGKTTLLSMLGAMLRPTSGSILIDGVNLAELSEGRLPSFRASKFGFIFQDFNLLGALSATENVEFALNLAGTRGRPAQEESRELLESLGLADRLSFRPAKLSGGEKQRVAIARSLANDPAVILADEPTANLDSKIGREIARLLRKAAKERNKSIVIVSHDDRLKEIADRTLWLEDGSFKPMNQMSADPVCGMVVSRETSTHLMAYGQTYYFCSELCRGEFEADPDRFAGPGHHPPDKRRFAAGHRT